MDRSTTGRKLLIGLAIVVVSTSGCGGQPESLPPSGPVVFRQKISIPKERVSEAEPVLPEKKPLLELPESVPKIPAEGISKRVAHLYNPSGKLDPFQPIFVIEARKAEARKKIRKRRVPLTPLQKIELSQLKLVGIIISPAGNKALVEEPSGKGYIITEGTDVGTNFGRVKKILNDRVIVEEEVEDLFSGKIKHQTTELKLQKKLGDV